jgi:hypothetical protein
MRANHVKREGVTLMTIRNQILLPVKRELVNTKPGQIADFCLAYVWMLHDSLCFIAEHQNKRTQLFLDKMMERRFVLDAHDISNDMLARTFHKNGDNKG